MSGILLCLRLGELVPPWSQGLSNVLELDEAWKSRHSKSSSIRTGMAVRDAGVALIV